MLDNFKMNMRNVELISKYDNCLVENDEIVYDLYYSILRDEGSSSKNVIDDEIDMFMYIIDYMRTKRMISILELVCRYYYLRRKEVDELFSEVSLN